MKKIAVTLLIAAGLLALTGWLVTAAPRLTTAGDQDATILPMGTAQGHVREAYRTVLSHLYDGGRVHWAAGAFTHDSIDYAPGDFVIPGGLASAADGADVTGTVSLPRAYALRPGGVALLRSTVTVPIGAGHMTALWELAEVRQALDGYLMGALPYSVFDEAQVGGGALEGHDLLVVPAIRADAVYTVTGALSDAGALDAISAFVEAGGTLYAQSTGAYVAEAAGLLPVGTVDLDNLITLASPDDFENRGRMTIQQPTSPLAFSWLTDTLYILTDPTLHPSGDMEIVATLNNTAGGSEPAAVLRAPAGRGQVILIAGHPTDAARRTQMPLFLDAVLLALSSRAELTGDAVQTFNPDYPLHEFPAYERVPVSVTLAAANLWDAPMGNVVLTETVSGGFVVSETTISPAYTRFYTVTKPITQTVIVWNLGELPARAEVHLSYQAQTDPGALAAGVATFSTGVMRYDDPELGPTEVSHRPFVLTAQMAARLVGDRDLEADRHYRIPEKGIYLDVTLPLENKEYTLAANVVVTDWVYLIYPVVDGENQHVILHTNDGQTVWMRNEPFFWGHEDYPLPRGVASPTATLTLDDWPGEWCVFTSTHGIHTDPPSGFSTLAEDYGSFVTIPPTYTDYITVTADHELLLPCLPLTFDLGGWPGYWYQEPAVRYGVHSRELFSQTVVFHGTPISDGLVVEFDAGSVYVNAGADPVPFHPHLEAATPYAAAAPTITEVSWQDVWSRTHTLPLRASFYDVFDWDSCATCNGGLGERHAAFNLTFGLDADLDGDGSHETLVREIPTRLASTRLTLMGKSYNLGSGIPASQNLVELPIFNGLGVTIDPANDTWYDSWRSASGHVSLLGVTETHAYDHLIFQQDIPPGATETFYVDAMIHTYDFNREGMFKLHDGARLVYHQMAAGPNRYEVYDSHVHSVLGLSSDGQVSKQAGPTLVSVYGDSLYYVFQASDRHDPRTFDTDPYMNSWGYGDFVATTYVGGREEKTLFHSVVEPGDHTRLRVSLDNNTGVTLTNVALTFSPPAGIDITRLYADPGTAPEPIWPELAFLNLETIPDAWRGVYYFDVELGAIDPALLNTVVEIPIELTADGLPAGYEVPPARLAVRSTGGSLPDIIYGPAHSLTLTDTLPDNISLLEAAPVTQAEGNALMLATDHDATHPEEDTAAGVFATFLPTMPFTIAAGVVTFELPVEWQTIPAAGGSLYVAARAAITRAHHGPNLVNDGPTISYVDPFGVTWYEQGAPFTVEAAGAVVGASYYCRGAAPGYESVVVESGGWCGVMPGETSQIVLRVTVYNEGDAVARGVTMTLDVPGDLYVVESTPLWIGMEGNDPAWNLGDLAPGGWRTLEVVIEIKAAAVNTQETVVKESVGAFVDDFSGQAVAGQFAGAFQVGVLNRTWCVYLPVIQKNYPVWWPQSVK